jgi:hypothetical protein
MQTGHASSCEIRTDRLVCFFERAEGMPFAAERSAGKYFSVLAIES